MGKNLVASVVRSSQAGRIAHMKLFCAAHEDGACWNHTISEVEKSVFMAGVVLRHTLHDKLLLELFKFSRESNLRVSCIQVGHRVQLFVECRTVSACI